jgi:PAS domain S-box-containing protein
MKRYSFILRDAIDGMKKPGLKGKKTTNLAEKKATVPRKKKETLGGKEKKIRLLYEEAPISYQSLDEKGIIVEVNRTWLDTLGYSRKEVIGRFFGDFLTEQSRGVFRKAFPRFKKVGEIHGVEFELMKKDGSRILVSYEGRIAYDEKGNLMRTHCVFQDITERQRAEEALRENEHRLASIFNTVGDVIFHLAVEPAGQFRFVSVNPAFLRVTGLSQEMVVGRMVNEIIPEPSLTMVLGKYRQAIEENTIVCWEETSNYPTGQLTGEVSIAPVFDDKGTCTHLVGSVHDITERRRMEETLRESEERFRTTLEKIEDGYYEVDLAGNFTFSNDSMCRMLGYAKEEIMGMNNREYTSVDTAKIVYRTFNEVYRTGNPTKAVGWELIRKDKSKLFVETSITLMRDENSASVGFRGICRNITNRKKAEEALLLSEWELKKTQEFSHVGSWEWNIKTNEVKWSDEMFRIFGIDKERNTISLDTVIASAIHPDDKERVEQANLSVIKHKKPMPIDYRVIWPDKSIHIVWAEAGELVLDEKGSPSLLRGYAQDITERKKIEEMLRESEGKHRLLLENAEIGIGYYDVEGNVLKYNNRAAWDLNGIPSDFVGRNVREIFGDEFGNLIKERNDGVIETGEIKTYEDYVKLPSGDRYFSSTYSRITDEKGNALGVQIISNDITQSRQMEDELEKSEERYRNLFENSPLGIYRTTPDGKILMANPALVRMLDFHSYEELAMHNLEEEEFESNYQRRKFKELIEKEGEVRGLEVAWKRQDGFTIFVRENARIVRDENGEILYYEGTVEDITDRKKTEKALRKSEERYRSLVDNSLVGVYMTTLSGDILFANNALISMLEFESFEEFARGGSLSHYRIPDHRRQFIEIVARDGVVDNFETEFVTKTGDTRWVLISARRDGDIISGIIKDITDRKQMESAVQKADAIYRSLVEKVPAVVYTTTFGKDAPFFYVSPRIESLLGFTPEEWMADHTLWFRQVHPEDREKVLFVISQRIAYDFEYRLITKSGETIWVNDYATVLPNELGEPYYLQGFFVDITERKKAEEELQRYREYLEELVQTRTSELEKSLSLIRATLDSTEDGIIVTDTQQRVHAWNSRFLEILNIPQELMEQWVEGDFFRHIAHQMVNPQPLKNRLERLSIDPYETSRDEFIFKGDQIFECYVGPQKLIDEVIGHVWSFRNVTERSQAERALQESEKKYKGLAESLMQVVYQADPNTLEENYINESVLRMYGYTVEEWLSDTSLWKKIIHPEDKEWVDALFEEAKAKRKGGSVEYRIIKKDGTVIWVSDSFSWEKDREGNIVSMNGIVTDITEHREAEEKLRKYTEELEKFNRAMVDREKRIVEMKKEVNSLCRELGRELEYPPIWEK